MLEASFLLLLIHKIMSHLKALILTTAMVNFVLLATYQLFYSGTNSVKYHANLNFEFEQSLGKNSVMHRGKLKHEAKVQEQIEQVEVEQVQEKAIEQLEEFIGSFLEEVIEDGHYTDDGTDPEFHHEHDGITNTNICKQSNDFFLSNRDAPTTIVTDVDIPARNASVHRIGEFTEIPFNATLFWTANKKFHYFHLMGKNFLCTFQKYNHVPGHVVYNQYNNFEEAVRYPTNITTRKFKEGLKRPDCMMAADVFPKTYLLYQEEDCKAYFGGDHSAFTSFVIDHREEVYLLSKELVKRVLSKYKNGSNCGQIADIVLVRTIDKPLSIDGKFLSVEYAILVASTDPFIAYRSVPYYKWWDYRISTSDFVGKLKVPINIQRKNISITDFDETRLNSRIDGFVIDFSRIVQNLLLHDHRVFEVLNVTFLLNEHLEPIFETLSITAEIDDDLFREVLDIEETFQQNLIVRHISGEDVGSYNNGETETTLFSKVVDYSDKADPFLGRVHEECL